jgi:hypothetical protein
VGIGEGQTAAPTSEPVIVAGAQIFFGSDREEDVAFLVSLRHHWSVQNGLGGLAGTDHP